MIVYLERPYMRIILKYDHIIWSFHCIQLQRPENTVSYSWVREYFINLAQYTYKWKSFTKVDGRALHSVFNCSMLNIQESKKVEIKFPEGVTMFLHFFYFIFLLQTLTAMSTSPITSYYTKHMALMMNE